MNTSKNPCIKKNYSIVPYNADDIELKTGVWNSFSVAVRDESKSGNLFRIAKLLTGELSPAEIAKTLNISRSEVEALIDHLTQLGVIEYGATSILDTYLDTISPTLGYIGKERKIKRPILLLGNNSVVSEIQRLLRDQVNNEFIQSADVDSEAYKLLFGADDCWMNDGLEFEKALALFKPWASHFIVFAQENINPVYGNRFNKIAHVLNIAWINIAVDGPMLFVGPTIIGGTGPCYDCFEARVVMNLRENISYLRYKEVLAQGKVHDNNLPLHNVIASLIASFSALEILNFSFTECSFTQRKVLSIYLPTMEIVYNEVLQLSSCETCVGNAHRDNHQHYFDIQMLLKNEQGG